MMTAHEASSGRLERTGGRGERLAIAPGVQLSLQTRVVPLVQRARRQGCTDGEIAGAFALPVEDVEVMLTPDTAGV